MKKNFAHIWATAIVVMFGGDVACNMALGFDAFEEGVCLQDAKQCSGNTPQSCNAGQWLDEATGPCMNQTCVDGVCSGECAPGKRCVGAIVQVCTLDGNWAVETTCSVKQVCVAGACLTECTFGDLRCFDNTLQTCDTNGLWGNGTSCVASTCDPITASCVGICEQGQTRCFDNTPQTCNVSGQWIGNDPCLGGQSCKDGTCI